MARAGLRLLSHVSSWLSFSSIIRFPFRTLLWETHPLGWMCILWLHPSCHPALKEKLFVYARLPGPRVSAELRPVHHRGQMTFHVLMASHPEAPLEADHVRTHSLLPCTASSRTGKAVSVTRWQECVSEVEEAGGASVVTSSPSSVRLGPVCWATHLLCVNNMFFKK